MFLEFLIFVFGINQKVTLQKQATTWYWIFQQKDLKKIEIPIIDHQDSTDET